MPIETTAWDDAPVGDGKAHGFRVHQRKRACRGRKARLMRVVLSAHPRGCRSQRQWLPGMRSEVGQRLVAASERAAGSPLRPLFPAPGRDRGRSRGVTVGPPLGVAQRLAGPPALAWHSSGAKARDPGPDGHVPLGATLDPGTPRLRRKSWCLRFERAHDIMTRFHRGSAVQKLRGITSVSGGRPLFIPF